MDRQCHYRKEMYCSVQENVGPHGCAPYLQVIGEIAATYLKDSISIAHPVSEVFNNLARPLEVRSVRFSYALMRFPGFLMF